MMFNNNLNSKHRKNSIHCYEENLKRKKDHCTDRKVTDIIPSFNNFTWQNFFVLATHFKTHTRSKKKKKTDSALIMEQMDERSSLLDNPNATRTSMSEIDVMGAKDHPIPSHSSSRFPKVKTNKSKNDRTNSLFVCIYIDI